MAPAGKGNMTPGRQRKKTQAQYFDVGKVGRKTGLVLKDTGIRDEHDMEPVTGIFSSPVASPQRNGDQTLSSSDMHMQESSAPEVTDTILLRKTSKLPPPRAATPKHTHIGSPKRMSSSRPISRGKSLPHDGYETTVSPSQALAKTQPPANRKLDFASNGVRKSIEEMSPFRPKKVLRRSAGSARGNPFSSPREADIQRTEHAENIPEELGSPGEKQGASELGVPQMADDGPVMLDEDDVDQAMPNDEITEAEEAQIAEQQATPTERTVGRTRKSGDSVNSTRIQHTPHSGSTTRSRKRDRTSLEMQTAEVDISQSEVTESGMSAGPSQKKPRGKTPKDKVVVHNDDVDRTIDPSLLAYGDQHTVEDDTIESNTQATAPKGKSKCSKPAAPKERDANRAVRAASSPVKLHDGASKLSKSPRKPAPSRGVSMGPVSNVNLRATTPFEDAGTRISRYGRPVLKPLQYWANETRVWKNGEVEGIVRAEEVLKPKPIKKRGRKPRRKLDQGIVKLEDIEEESESDSVAADEWEEAMGVIAGPVANWDPATRTGDRSDLVREDLAFASTAIVTRDVANSEFRYAKIITLPFFGTGVVELPPSGFKRAKNSRKMQMCFFVHEGKVMVEVGVQQQQQHDGSPDDGGEVNQFAVSKGGVWVVPRGNNYAITNESATRTARIFFAQGCEVDVTAGGGGGE